MAQNCYLKDVCNCIQEKDGDSVIDIQDLPLSAKLMASIRKKHLKCHKYIEDEAGEYCVLKKRGAKATIYKRSLGSRDIYELIVSDRRGRTCVRQTESRNDGAYSLKKLYELACDAVLKKEVVLQKLIGRI